jgi:hypothetical protein
MSRASLIAAALTCAMVSACSDQTAPTAASAHPDLRTSQNPDGPGAQVGGSEVPFTFFFTDSQRGLGIVAGLTPATLPGFCAGEDVERGTSFLRDVVRPDGSIMSHERAVKVTLMVFRLDPGEDICDGSAPFAVGTGNFMNHDNDFFVSGNRTNAFGFRINGQVRDLDGARHHVSAFFEGTFSRQGDARVTKAGIVLH